MADPQDPVWKALDFLFRSHPWHGVSDRGASVRIPWQVAQDKKGYIEDRRPCANIDPYTVCRLIMETVSGSF